LRGWHNDAAHSWGRDNSVIDILLNSAPSNLTPASSVAEQTRGEITDKFLKKHFTNIRLISQLLNCKLLDDAIRYLILASYSTAAQIIMSQNTISHANASLMP
jgi:hypothetical protein